MIKNGIAEGKWIETSNNTLSDLRIFQDFLCFPLIKHKDYERMLPRSNHPGRFSLQLKLKRLNSLNTVFWKVSTYVLYLIKQGFIFTVF